MAAHSVVSGTVKPYTVVGGNPARLIKRRFDPELTDLLLRLRWCDYDGQALADLLPLLCDPDLERVREKIRRLLDREGR